MSDVSQNKEEFLRIWKASAIPTCTGADALLKWLLESDFFEAPASSRYHLAVPGGLCQHSLNVYRRLKHLLDTTYPEPIPYATQTIAIVSLLHDICKTNMYKETRRNQKTYDKDKVAKAEKDQIKHDSLGDYIWESVPSYEINEDFIFGHGEKSVYLINKFMKLTDEEAQAIRYHMSSWKHDDISSVGKVYAANHLAFLLHVADEMATYMDE